MYNKFYGFTEKPFKLVPDPTFLFLSKSHEEALAHLTYAVSNGDGFAAVTGEVGTGKTTLCRAFVESLEDSYEAAYIFNPMLDAIELLKAINDEFDIPSDADNSKDLIDTLNSFLLKKAAEGKHIILIIDEAHNLSSDVLEQVRLLSNLETTRQKLLQILLIGQPELDDILESQEMRQLEQRISLRYHLAPLTHEETKQYIEHRLTIASQKPAPRFTPRAIEHIYRYAAGIPRLVNIACDRALLIGFCAEKRSITRSVVRKAVNELSARGRLRRERTMFNKPVFPILGIVLGATAIGLFIYTNLHVSQTPQAPQMPVQQSLESAPSTRVEPVGETAKPDSALVLKAPQKSAPQSAPDDDAVRPNQPAEDLGPEIGTDETMPVETAADEPKAEPDEAVVANPEPPRDLEAVLTELDSRESGLNALQATLELWRADTTVSLAPQDFDDTYAFIALAAKQKEFMVQQFNGDFSLITRLNLPVILALQGPENGEPVYLTAARIENDFLVLEGVQPPLRVEAAELETVWTGEAYVLWKDFFDIRGTIPGKHTADAVVTLKMLLRKIGFDQLRVNGTFDAETREAVKALQARHGVDADGIVGSVTKIILYNEVKTFQMPHLMRATG